MIELPIPPRKEREVNPEFVELLKGAKQLLWDGVSPQQLPWGAPNHDTPQIFICRAIAARGESNNPGIDKLMQDIGLSLGKSITYGMWVLGQVGNEVWYKFVESRHARPRLQAARLRWLNQLIEEYGGTP